MIERKKSAPCSDIVEDVEDSRTQATPTKEADIELHLTQDTYLSKSESDTLEPTARLMPNDAHHSALSMISTSQLSDDVFRNDSSLHSAPPNTTDSNGNYFKFPSVGNNVETVSDEEIEKVAYEFSLQIIHDCISELQQEVNYINDLEEKARELFSTTLERSMDELILENEKKLSNQSTIQSEFVSTNPEEKSSPDFNRQDYVKSWLIEDQAGVIEYEQLPAVVPVENDDEPEMEHIEWVNKPTVYDSSDEEDIDLVGFGHKQKMYGSFDETVIDDNGDDTVNLKINQMIIDIVSDAVSELQSECRLESDLSRRTADVVLEILAGAIQTSRQASLDQSTKNTESDIENTYVLPSDESTSSSELWRVKPDTSEDDLRQSILDSKPTPPRFSDSHPVDSIEIHHFRSSNKGVTIRASTEPSIEENEEQTHQSDDGLLEPLIERVDVSRKSSVTFGTCHVHQIEPVAYLSSGSSMQSNEVYTDAELRDLIESEAIALTEDALFLAKQEIFREFNAVSEDTIISIANELVFDVIDNAIKAEVSTKLFLRS